MVDIHVKRSFNTVYRRMVVMDERSVTEGQISNLLADEYGGRILRSTYDRPLTVQQISKSCDIPIAVAYRRVGKMEEVGLMRCVGQEEVYRGKKVRYYQCAVKLIKFTFYKGDISMEVDFLPEDEMSTDPIASEG